MNNISKYLDELNSIKNRYSIPYTKENMKEEHYVEIMYEELSIEMIKEIERLNNIINKTKQELLNKKEIIEESKYFKLVYYIDWNMQHTWDKRIVCKIDEIINIIDEVNK